MAYPIIFNTWNTTHYPMPARKIHLLLTSWNSKQIFSDKEQINLFNLIKFSGVFFTYTCGEGYLRPFELATYRLNNMIEILQNWNDYIINNNYLPQRGASFILNNQDQILYKYFSSDVLGYSPKMEDPLAFLSEKYK